MKRCPYCAEEIQDAAILCRYCHSSLKTRPPAPAWPRAIKEAEGPNARAIKITLPPAITDAMNSQGIEFRKGGMGSSFLYWSARWLLALIGKDHGELQTTLMGLLDIAANNNYPLVKNLLECVEIVNRHEAAVTAQRQLATPPVSEEQ